MHAGAGGKIARIGLERALRGLVVVPLGQLAPHMLVRWDELVLANDDAAAEPNPQQNKWAGGAKPLFLFFAIGAATGAAVAGIVHVFRNIESPDKP